MAKKKKKGQQTSTQVPTDQGKTVSLLDRAHAEYERGSYAGVRRLLAQADGTGADWAELEGKVQVDKMQVLVGLGAVLAVVLVGFLTLVR